MARFFFGNCGSADQTVTVLNNKTRRSAGGAAVFKTPLSHNVYNRFDNIYLIVYYRENINKIAVNIKPRRLLGVACAR